MHYEPKTTSDRLRPANVDRASTVEDAQDIAATREATRLLAAAGYDKHGQERNAHKQTADDLADQYWSNDPLLPAYIDMYGTLDAAVDMMARNRAALRATDNTTAFTARMTGGASRRSYNTGYTTALLPAEAGEAVQVTGRLSSASYAMAIEGRVTEPTRWEDARAPYGAHYDTYGEVVYGETRIARFSAGHVITATLPDGTTTQYSPLDTDRMDAYLARQSASAANGAKGGRPITTTNPKAQAARERKRAQRERERAAKQTVKVAEPVTVQTATAALPRMAWLADE